jgi:tRNA(adenine34) deaminase
MLNMKLMQRAIQEAKRAAEYDEVPVGAVIIDSTNGEILAEVHNEMESRKDPTAHAEMLAIRQACEKKENSRLENCDLYVTLEPCPMCAQAISFARLRRVYFGAYDPKGGGVDHGPQIFNSSSCHHRPEVIGGIEEQVCSLILKDFFEMKR